MHIIIFVHCIEEGNKVFKTDLLVLCYLLLTNTRLLNPPIRCYYRIKTHTHWHNTMDVHFTLIRYHLSCI